MGQTYNNQEFQSIFSKNRFILPLIEYLSICIWTCTLEFVMLKYK